MSGSTGAEPEARGLLRVAAFGAAAMLGPPLVGILIALTQPGGSFRVEGLGPVIAVCGGLAIVAALIVAAARTEPLTLGLMTGSAFAIGSLVRDGSFEGAALTLASGAAGGYVAGRDPTVRGGSRRELHVLLVVAAMLAAPLALLARQSPTQASSQLAGLPVLASATPRGDRAAGYVLHGRPGRFLDGADLIRVERRGIGSWTASGALRLPEDCRFPDGVDATDRRDVVVPTHVRMGIRLASVDVARACYVQAERVVVGVGPPGTTRIEAVTISGEEVDVPVGVGGAYVVLLEDDTIAANFVRVTFHDARGTLLDSKPLTGPGDYMNLAYISGLHGPRSLDTPPDTHVTVSKYIITPAEFLRLCGTRPPHGDGFVTIGIVRREDGVTREVVLGTGMPLSSGHPRPDPPVVRPSAGVPCFVR